MLHNHKNAQALKINNTKAFEAAKAINRILEFSGEECTCTLGAVYTSTPAGFSEFGRSGSETTPFAYCKQSKLEVGTAWE